MKGTILIGILACATFWSCGESKNKLSNIPSVEILGTEVFPNDLGKDTLVRIFIQYADGDGNIGLTDADTFPPFQFEGEYFNNLWVLVESKENGVWKTLINPLTLDTLNFNERLPNITPTGKNKWVQGQINLMVPAAPFTLTPDSVRYRITLIDRTLNRSQEAISETVVLKH